MQSECTQLELPLHFTAAIIKSTQGHTRESSTTYHHGDGPLREATAAQEPIGYYNMAIKFVAKEWTHVLKTLGVKHPEQNIKQVLSMIWNHNF